MVNRKKRLKLIVIFIFTLSLFLISLLFVYIFLSKKTMEELADYANKIDMENNKILSKELFFNTTTERAEVWDKNFEIIANIVKMLTIVVEKQLIESKDINLDKTNKIKMKKIKDRDMFVDNTQKNFNIYYWGNRNYVPDIIKKRLISFKKISDLFIGIKKIDSELFAGVYASFVDNFAFGYPRMDAYFRNISYGRNYSDIYLHDFPLQIKNKNIKIFPTCFFERPYKDISDVVVMGVKSAIYDKGKLFAHVGIDLRFEEIQKSMLSGYVDILHDYNKENAYFLLSKNGKIITFPQNYAELFSLPKKYLNLDNYLEHTSTKLSDSTEPVIKSLNNNIAQHDSGIQQLVIDNSIYVVAFSKIKKTGWTLGQITKKETLLSSTIKSKELIDSTVRKVMKRDVLITIIFLTLSFLILYITFKYYILSPVKKIRKEITKVGKGDFNIDIKEEGTLEIAELSSAFNYLGRELRNYLINLKHEIKTRQEIEDDIKIAEHIQRSILPDIRLFPTDGKFQLETRLNAAKNISGDFYDYFYVSDKRIALLVADVSGKGIQAAFFMSMCKALIKHCCFTEHNNDPGNVLEIVNNALCMNNRPQMFVTVVLTFYNIEDGIIHYANAGHHSSFIVRSKNNVIETPASYRNVALGIIENVKYRTGTEKMEVGDTGIVFTDGVTEAVSREGEEYGIERLKNVLLDNCNLPLDSLCDTIIKDVTDFEGEKRFDDITLLALKRFL